MLFGSSKRLSKVSKPLRFKNDVVNVTESCIYLEVNLNETP